MKRFIMRLAALTTLLVTITGVSFADVRKNTANENKIKKENADYVNYLKKHYGCKVYVRESAGGSWYYLLEKDNCLGIVDQNGRLLSPIDKDYVSYLDPMAERTVVADNSSDEIKVKVPATEAAFVVRDNKGYTFMNTDGKINSTGAQVISYMPGYYFYSAGNVINRNGASIHIDKESWNNGAYGTNIGLMTRDGHLVLPAVYSSISLGSDSSGPEAGYSVAYLDQVRNGVTYSGAKSIDRSLPDVPCCFDSVWVCDNSAGRPYWVCRARTEDYSDDIIFDPTEDYTYLTRYRDEGERLYLAKQYDKALDFYTGEGASAPWAKFYTGCIKQKKADDMNYSSKYLTKRILFDRAVDSDEAYKYLDGKYPKPNFDIERAMLYNSASDFVDYISNDSVFAVAAHRHFNEIMGDGGLVDHLDLITIHNYEIAIGVLEENRSALLQARYEAQQRALELERQRLAEEEAKRNESKFFEALLTGVLVAGTQAVIQSATSSSSSNSYTSSSSSSRSSSTSSSKSSSSSSSVSSSRSSSSSNELSEAEKGMIRKLETKIENEEKYLRHAEEWYAKDHDAITKYSIESHKRAIERYKKLIEDIKNHRL